MRRRTIIILVLGAVVLLALVWIVFRPDKEPEYNGKKLSEWAIQIRGDPSVGYPSPVDVEEASIAIRSMGTNAIPYLLKWIDYQTPTWRLSGFEAINNLFRRCSLDWRLPDDPKMIRSFAAVEAFQALGPAGDSVIPSLVSAFYGKRRGVFMRSAFALGHLGTNGCAHLISALTNADPDIRATAAHVLGWSQHPESRIAIPALITCMEDPEARVATQAAIAPIFQSRPDLAIPALIKALRNPKGPDHTMVIMALGRFGGQASNVLPVLWQDLNSTNAYSREWATNTIRKIDPNALPK